MFVIALYDSPQSTKFRKILKKYLFWRQNSVFDWELTKWDIVKLQNEISNNIINDIDYVIFYVFTKIWKVGIKPDIIEYGKKRESNDFII
jgi:CRISPR-associated protein Cas2